MNFSYVGSIWYSTELEEVMISLLIVLRPMLAKRMAKTMKTTVETTPPVTVVYYASPL